MYVSQKIQYALRALFELAKHFSESQQSLCRIQYIAEKQNIPFKFLEGLLNELKKGEFVVSYRGKNGGYHLAKSPDKITVADLMKYMQGPVEPVGCLHQNTRNSCPQQDACVFKPMWRELMEKTLAVYESYTLEDFITEEKKSAQEFSWDYMI